MNLMRSAAGCLLISLVTPTLVQAAGWGALALDTEKAERSPYYGVGGGDTEQEAIDNAMKFCQEAGGKACKSLVTYEQCGALAVSGTGDAGWGKAPTKIQAEAQAIAGCQNDQCKVVSSDCN
jgi:hypothetical protein